MPESAENLEKGRSLWKDARARMYRSPAAIMSLVLLIVIVGGIALGPVFSPYEFDDMDFANMEAQPPSKEHWFGTDEVGRDMFTRVMYGGRVSFAVALAATVVSLLIGVTYGSVSAFAGGKVDACMMRFVDVLYGLPFTLLVILLVSLQSDIGGDGNLVLLFVAIGAVEWLTMARIVRGQVLGIKEQEYIEACRVLGYSSVRIVFRHIVPNILGTVIIYITLTIPSVMLLEAFLSFLGLGAQAPNDSWGSLINDGAKTIEEYPWLLIGPGGMLSLTLLFLNFLGDGLRDALDPRRSVD